MICTTCSPNLHPQRIWVACDTAESAKLAALCLTGDIDNFFDAEIKKLLNEQENCYRFDFAIRKDL